MKFPLLRLTLSDWLSRLLSGSFSALPNILSFSLPWKENKICFLNLPVACQLRRVYSPSGSIGFLNLPSSYLLPLSASSLRYVIYLSALQGNEIKSQTLHGRKFEMFFFNVVIMVNCKKRKKERKRKKNEIHISPPPLQTKGKGHKFSWCKAT